MRGTSFLLLFFLGCAIERTTHRDGETLVKQKFHQCYEESDSFKHKEGKVEVTFRVTKEGTVRDPRIKRSDFKDANFHACLLGIVRSITYEPDEKRGTIEVDRPISFYQKINEDI